MTFPILDAPFLELAYYVGEAALDASLQKLIPDFLPGTVPVVLSALNAVGLVDKPELIEARHGTIVLRTEGEPFCGTARRNSAKMTKLGRRAYARFVSVAESIEPVYGAIVVEYSLETPAELRKDPRSLAFRDFFLSRVVAGKETVEQVLRLAGDEAYVERLSTGIYVSMSPEFNPEGRGLPPVEAQERSAQIGSVLGKAVT